MENIIEIAHNIHRELLLLSGYCNSEEEMKVWEAVSDSFEKLRRVISKPNTDNSDRDM